jgi:phosphoribosyl-ATP pyrophosphohydrolase/phosphoribosyl-AMP cyclohydrolase
MAENKSAVEAILNTVQFDKDPAGLVPAVVQDVETKDVLMVGFMNRQALEKTIETELVTFWTRSRQKLWTKGETSGNTLNLVSIRINCNEDSLLIFAKPIGATCHTGHPTCYYREAIVDSGEWKMVTEPQFDPDEVYKK